MAKQLNSETGKGWFVAQGQSSIESLLAGGATQKELAELAGMWTGEPPRPNAGAVSNILKSLAWGPFNGLEPTDKPATEKKSSAPAQCPGRVEGFILATTDVETVTPSDVESVILSDSVKWNQLILKQDEKELSMLAKFLKSGGFSPCPRVSLRAEFERAEQERLALIEESIDAAQTALYAVDAELANDASVLKAIRAFYS